MSTVGDWIQLAGLASKVIGANQADKTNREAIAGQQAAADKQIALAQEMWDFQRDTYLPRAMKAADDQLAMSKQLTDRYLDDSNYYRGIADDSFTQAKKSWKYQDAMMGLADDYMSGKVGDTMAGKANADVQQRFAGAEDDMVRAAARYGINPGSGGFAASLGDLYQQKALAGAGAQTAARQAARDKAEGLVAMAAGAGQAGFGTGVQLGGLTNNFNAGASATNANSLSGLNGVNSTLTNGVSGINNSVNGAVNSWNSLAKNGATNAWAELGSGLANSAWNIWGSKGP
jgi:hypothetical protein